MHWNADLSIAFAEKRNRTCPLHNICVTPPDHYLVKTLQGVQAINESSLVLDDLVDGAADAPPAPAAAVPQGEDGGRRAQQTTLRLSNSWWQGLQLFKFFKAEEYLRFSNICS